MTKAKPTLGLVINWGSDGWTGGPNYLKNIALAVGSLPVQRRPRLVYLVPPEQVASLSQYQGILPLADEVRAFVPETPLDDIDMLYPLMGGAAFAPAGGTYWIPDFQHCHLPQLFPQADLDWRNKQFEALARGRDTVVLSSQAALDDFRAFYPVSCPTYVLRFATSPEPGWLKGDPEAAMARHGVDGPYLICCNQFWSHKDHLTLFRALDLLRKQGHTYRLVCTGSTEDHRQPDYFPSLMRFLAENDLAGQVRILGLIDRSDQVQLLRAADAVIQPSRFEGWSTVIEDSRLLGKVVVHSDIPVHMEQGVNRGFAFRTGDAEDLARAILEAAPDFGPTANTDAEKEALKGAEEARLRFGLDIVRLLHAVMEARPATAPKAAVPKSGGAAPQGGAVNDLSSGNAYRFKGTQWYAPPLAGASTLAAALYAPEVYKSTLGVLKQLADDDYLVFLRGFMAQGMKRFGDSWRYADICTVLCTLARYLEVETYLEIGVRQGRSMAMVASCRPQVQVVGFDMWLDDYAGMDNPGPDFVREQLARVGYAGDLSFVEGNSHETLPRYFAEHPFKSFDLITVDGDHSPEGAARDLRDVLPYLRVGGAIVFDDIAHPAHPELLGVWKDEVLSRPEMEGYAFTELGYGVAFAIRMR